MTELDGTQAGAEHAESVAHPSRSPGSDLPEAILHGTLTLCWGCGRLAIFGKYRLPRNVPIDDDGQQRLDMDVWKCGGCGQKNESPVREP